MGLRSWPQCSGGHVERQAVFTVRWGGVDEFGGVLDEIRAVLHQISVGVDEISVGVDEIAMGMDRSCPSSRGRVSHSPYQPARAHPRPGFSALLSVPEVTMAFERGFDSDALSWSLAPGRRFG